MRSKILTAATLEALEAKIDAFLEENNLDEPSDIAAISYSTNNLPKSIASLFQFFRETPPHAHQAIIIYREQDNSR